MGHWTMDLPAESAQLWSNFEMCESPISGLMKTYAYYVKLEYLVQVLSYNDWIIEIHFGFIQFDGSSAG